MSNSEKITGMLDLYRVLDLTNEHGLLCGKILADIGADVIKIEKPGGDSARSIGPYYHDDPDPEKSLYWFAYNTNKRGITLDIETDQGREIFRTLVKKVDVVVESFPPGYMQELGLDYPELEKINPGIIVASITPFGQTGPYKDFKPSDIGIYAMGGYMYTIGDNDRPPVRISHQPQTWLHAGGQAAQGVVMALYWREMTGEGQHIDISTHDSITRFTPERVTVFWDSAKKITRRGTRRVTLGRIWECKDGYAYAVYWGGEAAKRWNLPLINWMDSKGYATDFLKNFDWDTFDLVHNPEEILVQIAEPTRAFFKSQTRAELLQGALEYNVQVYPINSAIEIADNIQLKSRDYWVTLDHPELGTSIRYPGPFAKTSDVPPQVNYRAPLIGEHNQEIYRQELNFSEEKIAELKNNRII
ncbi:MAG: CoA transferase [Dehalococcoidales bacterium]|nr:CoA transferase [Dehalococcoidales bacterium]